MTTDDAPVPPRPPRIRDILPLRVAVSAGIVVAVGGCVAAVLTTTAPTVTDAAGSSATAGHGSGPRQPGGPWRDLDGRPVTPDPGVTPAPGADSEASIGVRLRVPAVGLDVPVGAVRSVRGTVVPPGFRSAYWVRDRGVSVDAPERGTLVLVMHALGAGGRAPGNALVDRAGTPRVHPGDEVRVGSHRYRVQGADTVAKSGLDGHAAWRDVPGRLLLVTCAARSDGAPATRNVVVTADLVSGADAS